MEKDPVCGMQVDPKSAAGQAVQQGKTYYFCSAGCKAKFEAELAEVQLAQQELNNTLQLLKNKVVSQNEVALFQAKFEKPGAKNWVSCVAVRLLASLPKRRLEPLEKPLRVSRPVQAMA